MLTNASASRNPPLPNDPGRLAAHAPREGRPLATDCHSRPGFPPADADDRRQAATVPSAYGSSEKDSVSLSLTRSGIGLFRKRTLFHR